jgi:hypothetical protein
MSASQSRSEEAAERKARTLGWVKAGDFGGFVFHCAEFDDWREAMMSGNNVFRTFREALEAEGVPF